MARRELEWVSKRCPVCGKLFDYIKNGYEPSTCNNFDCLHRWLHDPRFRREKQDGKQD